MSVIMINKYTIWKTELVPSKKELEKIWCMALFLLLGNLAEPNVLSKRAVVQEQEFNPNNNFAEDE